MNKIEFIVELQEFPEYFISTKGRVFSEKYGDMRELKPGKDSSGYLFVILCKEGKRHNRKIHRLVGETFIERVEGKDQIDHINRNNKDNRLQNLRWCNNRENNINKGIRSDNTSGIKGVFYCKTQNRWRGSICIEKNKEKQKNFKTKEEAIKWREEMEEKYYKIEEEEKKEEYPGRSWRDEGETKYIFPY